MNDWEIDSSAWKGILDQLAEYARLKCEYGAKEEAAKLCGETDTLLRALLERMQAIPEDAALKAKEPDDLAAIRALRPDGPRKLPFLADDALTQRMAGAILGRFAACTLGVPVEGWEPADMMALAKRCGDEFPPVDYWLEATRPADLQYGITPRRNYTRGGIEAVPVDDDITYSILGLLILETYGFRLTTADVGAYWRTHLESACTAEWVALQNLKKGVPAEHAAEYDNPYVQWIGADIRSDGWAWACAGNPERAATLAYRDAFLTHRRNGIYGEMFFAAAQAAAFCVDTPREALEIGLTEIPAECTLAADVRWALSKENDVHNWADARRLVDARFPGMHRVHTNNNACLTIFGLLFGGLDYTKTIGEIVAMGMDNDCTAATAGSILGAIIGLRGIPEHWTKNFHNRVLTFIIGYPELKLDDVINRFVTLAKRGNQEADWGENA